MSHRDTYLQLANRGLVLLAGENGAGKSALLDGLLCAGFADTTRGYSPRFVNRAVGENCLLTQRGFDRQGTPYVIERPIKHRKKPKATIKVGSEKYTGDEAVERVYRQILGGCGYEAFVAGMVFGKGDAKFFTQLTDSKRKKILDEIMALGELNGFLEATKLAIDSVDVEAGEYLRQQEIREARLADLVERISGLQSRTEHFETMRKQELQACEKLLQDDQTKRAALKSVIAKLEKAVPKVEALLQAATLEYDDAIADVKKVNDAISEQQQVVAGLQAKISVKGDLLAKITTEVSRFNTLTDAACPTCKQDVSAEHVRSCIASLEASRKVDTTEIDKLKEQVKKKSAAIVRLKDIASAQITDAQVQKTNLDTARKTLTDTKSTLQAKRFDLREVEQRIERTATEHQRILDRTNDAQEELEGALQQQETLEAKKNEYQNLAAAAADKKLYYDFWLKGFGNAGIKSLLLDGVTPRLNESAQRYSQLLTDGIVNVGFSTTRELKDKRLREEFVVTVDIDDAAPDYTLCSGGQRCRADIIATLALGDVAASRVGVPLNLLFMDEVFDGLDSAGMERAAYLLQQIAQERSSIFVMTHSDAMAGYFPNVITVRREHGISTIE
jgi:DNA repair exonuclease SbcCD ATPase subunit